MKFLLITLITHLPDPLTGVRPSTTQRFRDVVDNAVLAEELGFDGYGVGERHERPFISSSPPVVLSHIAARTSRIRLFTAVTTLALLDPVRAFEDYATLDHLSGGRLELIIGKGNGAAQRTLYHVTPEDQWDRNRESYELFRQLWRSPRVTWSGRFRPPLEDAETWPRPLQQPIRVWHGSATSRESVDLAARFGDPLFSANVSNPIEPYAELIRYYRDRWAFYGHDPADALVGAGTAGYYAAPTSQEAVETWRRSSKPGRRPSSASASNRSSPRSRMRSNAAPRWSAAPSRSSRRCSGTTSSSGTRSSTCTRTRTGSPGNSTGPRSNCSRAPSRPHYAS